MKIAIKHICALVLPLLIATQVHATRKVVPVQLCVVKGERANNLRSRSAMLKAALAVKNIVWQECGISFRFQKLIRINDPSTKVGKAGDVIDPTLPSEEEKEAKGEDTEFQRVMTDCNKAFGVNAKSKLTEIFIRGFTDESGNLDRNTVGLSEMPEPCNTSTKSKKKTTSTTPAKPFVIDPSFFGAVDTAAIETGRTLAHENGHALSLDDLDEPRKNLMFGSKNEGDVLELTKSQCVQAKLCANEKIGARVDKDTDGTRVDRAGPRTRAAMDDTNDTPNDAGAVDIVETDVTYHLGNHDLYLQLLLRSLVDCGTSEENLYYFAVDLDGDPETGGAPSFPFAHSFQGADLYAMAWMACGIRDVSVEAWTWNGQEFLPESDPNITGWISTISLSVSRRDLGNAVDEPTTIPTRDALTITLPQQIQNPSPVEGFRVQAFAYDATRGTLDEGQPVDGSITAYPEPTFMILSPPSGPPGAEVSANGEFFTAGTEVEIYAGLALVAVTPVNPDGTFSTSFVMPDMGTSRVPVMAVAGFDDELIEQADNEVLEITSDVMIFDLIRGDAWSGCVDDTDCDGALNAEDNCTGVPNPFQADEDGDGIGDACDSCTLADPVEDADGDGVCIRVDNCPDHANESQRDADDDGFGDVCDVCPNNPYDDVDGDGVCDDNCPTVFNPDQLDDNQDGFGDACVSPDVELRWNVIVGDNASVGEGVVIDEDVVVANDVRIGNRVHIMTGASIGIGAIVGDDVLIGPNVSVGAGTELGRNVVVYGQVDIDNSTRIGDGSVVGSWTVVGAYVDIGQNVEVFNLARVDDHCQIEDGVYVGSTNVGSNCWLKRNSYVGHGGRIRSDFTLGENGKLSNEARIGNHVTIGDHRVVWDHARVGNQVTIDSVTSDLHLVKTIGYNVTLGNGTHIGHDTWVSDGVRIGSDTRIETDVEIWPNARIGNDVGMGSGCAVGPVIVGNGNVFGSDCQLWEGSQIGKNNILGDRVIVRDYCTLLNDNHVGDDVTIGADGWIGCDIVVPNDTVLPQGAVLHGSCPSAD